MRWFLVSALIAILVLDIWFAERVSNYEASSVTKYIAPQPPVEGPFILGGKSVVAWVLDFASGNDRAITALSTLAIAVFTVVLALATIGLWKAANQQRSDMRESLRIASESAEALKLQTRAAVASQIPVVGWAGVKLVEFDSLDKPIRDPVEPGPIPNVSKPVFTIQNTGPTRIFVLYHAIKWEVTKELAKEPHFGGMAPTGLIVKPDEIHHFTTSDLIRITETERRNLDEGAQLWVYGFVIYNDFLDEAHQMGTCAKWDPARGFVQVVRDNYTYHKHEKSYTKPTTA